MKCNEIEPALYINRNKSPETYKFGEVIPNRDTEKNYRELAQQSIRAAYERYLNCDHELESVMEFDDELGIEVKEFVCKKCKFTINTKR